MPSEELQQIRIMPERIPSEATPAARHAANLELTLKAARMGSWTWNLKTGQIVCGSHIEHLFGLKPGSFAGTSEAFFQLVHPADRAAVAGVLQRAVQGESTNGIEFRVIWPDGTVRWLMGKGQVFPDAQGHPEQMIGIDIDITDQKRAEEALAESERFARSTVDALSAHIAILDASGTILSVNRAWRQFASENPPAPADAFVGCSYLAVCDAAENDPIAHQVADGIRAVIAGERAAFSLEYPCHSPASQRWFIVRVSRFEGHGPVRVVVAHENITQRRLAEDRLRHESLHDSLTGLPNRQLFRDRVERCIARSNRCPGYHFAVLFLDLDRFKTINDGLGHAAGDQLLVAVAQRLRESLRAGDSVACHTSAFEVARMGGDEFTILLDNLADPADALRVAERIVQTISCPFIVAGHEITTGVSIGIANGGPSYRSPDEMLRDADAAMYKAKAGSKSHCVAFDSTMHQAAMTRLQIEGDLRRALERGEFLLHYQPIVCLRTQAVAGFEALIRWRRDGQLISPAQFIPIAEETGLIVPISRWVLRQACQQLALWQRTHPHTGMSINLSRRHLADPALVGEVAGLLRETGVAPASVRLEITESAVIDDNHQARHILQELKALGVRLALDDFGTGYSALSCLHQFPIDIVKIDRSFVAEMQQRAVSSAVVTAIITLAHKLGMTVVAEGIEGADQLERLRKLKCDFGQGYFFGRPQEAAAYGEPEPASLRANLTAA